MAQPPDRGHGVIAGIAIAEVLYESRRSLVVRGERLDDGRRVILKFMGEAATAEDAASYRHAWRTTRNASGLIGVSCPIALIEHDSRPGLVMPDRGCVSLDRLLDREHVGVQNAVAIAAGAARALAALLSVRLLHLEVSTSNLVYQAETGRVELIDFDTMSPLRREFPVEPGPGPLRATPAFMAPEQSGRTGHVVDHRSDLYSLGAVLFTLLAQRPPFVSADPLLVLHAHAAQRPPRLRELDPTIPGQVVEIVERLLEKDPDDRYQSPGGLASDLERCLTELRDGKVAPRFPLGAADVSPVLTFPDRLYGKDGVRRQLVSVLAEAAAGRAAFVIVSGEPGVGKSTVVSSLAEDVSQLGGVFALGKFDQRARTPYEAFRSALSAVARSVQRRPTAEAELLVADIQARLGRMGSVLVELVPDADALLGAYDVVPALQMRESRNRLTTAATEFISAVASSQRPLVLFLDDLQWAQGDSMRLLAGIVDAEIPGVLTIVAHRDGELESDNLEMLQQLATRRSVGSVRVEALDADALGALLRETLRCDALEAKELGSAVEAKTAGNPFFVRQFLDSLERDGALYVDQEGARWRWDLDAIGRYPLTENAAESVLALLADLPDVTRRALAFGACVGDHFTLQDLLVASAYSPSQAAEAIWPALYRELVVTEGSHWRFAAEFDLKKALVYRFTHDRVREAALGVLGPVDREDAHLRLGTALRHGGGESRLFEAVEHLDQALGHFTLPEELIELARCNLDAARRARAVGAFPQASAFCEIGVSLLPDDCWEAAPDLSLELYRGAAEAAWLLANHQAMDHWIDSALPRVEVPRDRASLLSIRIRSYHEAGEHEQALQLGLEVLATLGLRMPRRPTKLRIGVALLRARRVLRGRTAEDLLNLPSLHDPDILQAHAILSALANVAYGAQSPFFPLISAEAVRLTVHKGLATSSAVDFAHYALMQVVLGRYEDGVHYGELAMRLAEREPCRADRAWCAFLYHDFVHHWKHDIGSSIEPLRDAHRDALERGDPESAALLGVVELFESFQAGIALSEIIDRAAVLERSFRHEAYFHDLAGVTTQFVANLMGRADDCAVMAGPYYDERDVTESSPAAVRSAVAVTKLALLFWLGRFEDAAQLLDSVEAMLAGQTGNANVPWLHLQNAVVRLRVAPTDRETRRAVDEAERLFRRWSRLSPSNFLAQEQLILAEHARARGDTAGAVALFEAAIATAESDQRVLVAALAHRCAGELHSAAHQDERGLAHLRRAAQVFRRLGADAVADAIVADHPGADAPRAAPSAETVHLEELDLLAMLRASQALARDLNLDDMLRTLLETVQRHLGAERALVFVRGGSGLVLRATTDGGDGDELGAGSAAGVVGDRPQLDDAGDHIAALVRRVARTREAAVIDDAQTSEHRDHPHVRAARVRSVLCTPILSRSDVVGVLYLENNRHSAAFTGRPQQVLTLLAGQIAISLQNAQLVDELHQALDQQLELISAQSRFIPDQFLRALGKSDIRQVDVGNAVEKEFTVMVSDMRGFTSHLERMAPDDAMRFVNEYLRYLEPPILEYGGFVDSYAGDGVLALFDGGADSAVRAALAMLRAQRRYNHARASRGEGPVRTGIGLNTGSLVLGPMGGTDHLKFSVLGDAVNLASRLEALTKACGSDILVSDQTYGLLARPVPYRVRRIGLVRLPGRAGPVLVHEVFDEDSDARREETWDWLSDYEPALDLYMRGEVKAAFSRFARCASANPDDLVVQGYLDRCQRILRVGVPESWDATINPS